MEMKIILSIIAAVLFVVGLAIIFIVAVKKKGPKRVSIDKEFIDKLVLALGKINNIEGVKVDNGRLKFLVSDLDVVDFDTLKSMSTAGVFITGNHIKMLFQYDANVIMKEVSSLIKGE